MRECSALGQQPQSGHTTKGLSRSTLPDQGQRFTLAHLQVHFVQDGAVPECYGDPRPLQGHFSLGFRGYHAGLVPFLWLRRAL